MSASVRKVSVAGALALVVALGASSSAAAVPISPDPHHVKRTYHGKVWHPRTWHGTVFNPATRCG